MTRTRGLQPIPFTHSRRQTASPAQTLFWCTLLLALSMLAASCASTQATGADASVPIQQSEYLAVDGAKLFLMTRGENRGAPILLWLHGGPGGAERPLFRYFNSELERHFVVAYWDQRGAGRSFDSEADPHQLTVSRHLADLDTVVDHLRQTLGQDKVVIVGHSWGSMLGLLYSQQHPEKVAAYIGVAQVVSWLKTQQGQYDFSLAESTNRKDEAALTHLHNIGPPPYKTFDQQHKLYTLMNQYGGGFHKQPCKICVITKGMAIGLVTPWELISIHRGFHATVDAMTPELLRFDLEQAVPRVEVPVSFFLGRYDRQVDSAIAARYFDTLQAPRKDLVWFEASAHNIPFEEPDTFNRAVIEHAQAKTAGRLSK
ncbi:MAG TPA: alpha/beta hydrolase [Nitrospira sp.]|nr:alpha/beta hydrolase [Nitrospira sp.]